MIASRSPLVFRFLFVVFFAASWLMPSDEASAWTLIKETPPGGLRDATAALYSNGRLDLLGLDERAEFFWKTPSVPVWQELQRPIGIPRTPFALGTPGVTARQSTEFFVALNNGLFNVSFNDRGKDVGWKGPIQSPPDGSQMNILSVVWSPAEMVTHVFIASAQPETDRPALWELLKYANGTYGTMTRHELPRTLVEVTALHAAWDASSRHPQLLVRGVQTGELEGIWVKDASVTSADAWSSFKAGERLPFLFNRSDTAGLRITERGTRVTASFAPDPTGTLVSVGGADQLFLPSGDGGEIISLALTGTESGKGTRLYVLDRFGRVFRYLLQESPLGLLSFGKPVSLAAADEPLVRLLAAPFENESQKFVVVALGQSGRLFLESDGSGLDP